jgi:hypothetical protein
MATPSCPGTISTGTGGEAVCTEAWVAVEPFDIADLDTDTASAAFASGFVIIGMAWAIGWAVRELLNMIRR